MDPFTAAIVAAIPVVTSEIVKSSVKDAYEGLKRILLRRFGQGSAVNHAIDALEANPTSKGQAAVLAESVAAAHVTDDEEVMKAVGELLEELKKTGVVCTGNINVSVTGGHVEGVVGSNIGSVTFAAPRRASRR